MTDAKCDPGLPFQELGLLAFLIGATALTGWFFIAEPAKMCVGTPLSTAMPAFKVSL